MASKDVKTAAKRQIFKGIRQLYKNKEFFDICVIVHGQEFNCHRVVLASVSQYFQQKILPRKRVIHVKDEDVSPKQFELLLKILYKGHCFISQETAKDLLKMAGCLKIEFLTKLCEKFLMKNMLPEDSVQVWKTAEKYRLRTLSNKAMKMTLDNIENIRKEEWLALPKSLLLILLCQNPNMAMEKKCEKIISWVKQEEKVRKKHLVEFLPFLSFPLMNPTFVSRLTGTSHQFSDILFEYASEGNTYHVEGILENDINIQKRILARQSFKLNEPNLKVQARGVVVGGQGRRAYSFGLQDDRLEFHDLRSPSVTTGRYFASCMWRNEVYLSGDKNFLVYKPDSNKWEVLPDLPGGERRQKHSMSAVNSNIYVLGGHNTKCSILKYNIGDRVWNDVCNLPVNVEDASSAVLGHRIYLFGGKKLMKIRQTWFSAWTHIQASHTKLENFLLLHTGYVLSAMGV